MRVILFLFLLSLIFKTYAQTDSVKVMTVEDAVACAFRNTQALLTETEKKKLTRDIKSTWYRWIYQINERQILQEYIDLLHDLDRVATLRYEEGDIELLEKSWFLVKLAEIRTKNAVLNNEIDITGNLLRQLIHTTERIVPADSGLFLYQVYKGSDYSPDQILPDTSLPLQNLHLELGNYFIKLRYYKTLGLDHAQLIVKTSQAKYQAEEIDYLEFTRNLTEAYNIKMEYLEALNHYNQTAIELEHYAY